MIILPTVLPESEAAVFDPWIIIESFQPHHVLVHIIILLTTSLKLLYIPFVLSIPTLLMLILAVILTPKISPCNFTIIDNCSLPSHKCYQCYKQLLPLISDFGSVTNITKTPSYINNINNETSSFFLPLSAPKQLFPHINGDTDN